MQTTPALKTTRGSQSVVDSQRDGSPLTWTQTVLLHCTATTFATGGRFTTCATGTAVGVTYALATRVARAPKNGAEAIFATAVRAAGTRTSHRGFW